MKKLLRKIIVLTCIATLFILPASNAYALTVPFATLVSDDGVVRYYPYPVVLQPGDSMFIVINLSNPIWDVAANGWFGFNAFFESTSGGYVTGYVYRMGDRFFENNQMSPMTYVMGLIL